MDVPPALLRRPRSPPVARLAVGVTGMLRKRGRGSLASKGPPAPRCSHPILTLSCSSCLGAQSPPGLTSCWRNRRMISSPISFRFSSGESS